MRQFCGMMNISAIFKESMIIYKITNILNGKIYIGQTIQDLKERWYGHCRSISNCTAIARALKKYGKDNFTIEQIDQADSLEELNKKEVEWISRFSSNTKGIGYNLTTGGMNAIPSEETKAKMRGPRPALSLKQMGKKVSEETKRKMSEAHIGKVFSKETRERLSKAHTGKKFSLESVRKMSEAHKKTILCVNNNTIYNSAADAALALGLNRSGIYGVLQKKRNSTYGYIFTYHEKSE